MSTPSLVVDVWSWALDVDLACEARLVEWLSPDERERASKFATERLRGRWIVARAGMRGVLASAAGLDPWALRFSYNKNGKPLVAGWRNGAWFNLSHSCEQAVLAVCEAPVGADIERVGEAHEDVALRQFSFAEIAALMAVPESERAEAFYRCWTAKEAFLKALGTGFSRPSTDFSIVYASDAPPRLIEIAWREHLPEDWRFEYFQPALGFIGAVAVRTAGREIKTVMRRWSG